MASLPCSPLKLRMAARALAAGGVVGYPTEAVWGLGCDPLNREAVQEVLRLKKRPMSKGLILIASDFEMLDPYLLPMNEKVENRAFATWPGPVTWLWPASPEAPEWITGGQNRIAVRVTRHPVAAELCYAFGGAIVSTSANTSGRTPARSAAQLRLMFGQQVQAVLPGALGRLSKPTTIRDLLTGRTVRA